jgi:hypothetical protein
MEGAGQGREGGLVMLRTVSWDRCPPQAGGRRWFPARRLHLVDIENLAGASRPTLAQVRESLGLYVDCLAFGAMDQVEVASSHLTLLNAALGWPHARYRVRSGPDGADLALLDVLRHDNVAGRFTDVAIGSGDHLFAEDAAYLAAQGVWVTVVSRRDSLSPLLARAAHQVIFLDTAAEAA